MQIVENVIVTVQANGRAIDMELPAFLDLNELVEKIDGTLHSMPIHFAPYEHCTGLQFEGKRLEGNRTLAGYGIWDGSFVECVMESEVTTR